MSLNEAPLGKSSDYPDRYSPELLFPVPRDDNRRRIGLEDGRWPWFGEDLWQAWELSWLQGNGVPAVAWAEIRVPAASMALIESKSLKLYLNSLNQTVFSSQEQVQQTLERDLSSASGAAIRVTLHDVDLSVTAVGRPDGFELIDHQPVDWIGYEYCPERLHTSGATVTEKLCSHLLKSNCPVTGQPDWGSLLVEYSGPAISRAGLLQYVVGFRQQQDFHEHCVETVFSDIMRQCQPERLSVSARYTRRGGLDINPWRSTETGEAPRIRMVRQ
ncbi:NADPH-dependent 7-cyano-7-deazaguanine reductase QueF [Marinobacter sp.]|uniref:NADPH-dependent 7-cyano-7-deazaguanine reductase QueF n=1 Tax=Marinobacter sp. TaxID=50741 RepID=UPI00384ACAB6